MEPRFDPYKADLCKDRQGKQVFNSNDILWMGDSVHLLFKVNHFDMIKRLIFTIRDEKDNPIFNKTFDGPFKDSLIGSYDSIYYLNSQLREGTHTFSIKLKVNEVVLTKELYMDIKGAIPVLNDKRIRADIPIYSKPYRIYLPMKAKGTPPIKYRWRFNNTYLPTEIDTLKIASLDTSCAGEYQCIVINSYGRDSSVLFTLSKTSFKYPPRILDNVITTTPLYPELNKPFEMRVHLVYGDTVIKYRWYRNNIPITVPQANDSIYTITNFSYADTGIYSCIVHNIYGSDTTRPLLLQYSGKPVLNPKTIFSKPDKPYQGYPFVLWVKAPFCSKPFHYQWFRNDSLIADTTLKDTLGFSKMDTMNTGTYRCVVSNEFGSDSSNTFVVAVQIPIPAMIHPPKNIILHGEPSLDTSFEMSIAAYGSDSLRYSWFKDNEFLGSSYVHSYLIPLVEKKSEGFYRCSVSNRFGYDISNTYQLVAKVPKIVLENNGALYTQGATVVDSPFTLKLLVKEGKIVRYRWFKNGQVLAADSSNTLSFSSLKMSDMGEYFCTAMSKYDTASSNKYGLVVDSGLDKTPKILEFKLIGPAIVDSSCILYVKASGTPTPKYRWYKNNALLNDSNNFVEFKPLRFSDSGTYTCVAYNRKGADTTKPPLVLSVARHDPATFINKNIQAIGKSQVDEGYKLFIKATGNVPITFLWYKNNILIQNGLRDTLDLTPLVLSASGVYRCIAQNSFGNDTSTVFQLSVPKPDKPYLEPKNTFKSAPVAIAGKSYFLYIKVAAGNTPLFFQWFKNNNVYFQSWRPKDTLSFRSIDRDDAGRYHCTVRNSHGTAVSFVCTLKVIQDTPMGNELTSGRGQKEPTAVFNPDRMFVDDTRKGNRNPLVEQR